MKTLKDHVILYDAECPMCKVYTHAFTTTGMTG
jgi:predicted DCC family thiol-disulfide oxidoreductase YuxK